MREGGAELERTIRLLEVDLGLQGRRPLILRALTNVALCLTADATAVQTYAGQLAISTSAMLMARSGHAVYIDTPDAPLLHFQPPFHGGSFHESLREFGADILPS